MKVLIVDDDPEVRSLTSEILKTKLNSEILEAGNGSEALKFLESESVDIIILDNEMPVMDGYEFLGRVRSDNKLKKLPVIILTASNDSQTVSRYLNLDVSDYVLKPFLPNELVNKVTKNISARKKLLMIDDNEALKNFIEKIISTRFEKIDFIKAENGSDGLVKLIEHRPDLILLDINMPEMTGIEFIKKLRSEYSGIKTPVIMLTSINDKETIQMLAENNVLDYILKPVNINDFAKKINKALNQK